MNQIKQLASSDAAVATTRTGVNSTALAVIGWVLTNVFGWTIDVSDPTFIAVVVVAVPAFYRVTTVLTELWPPLGYIFFGVRSTPGYEPEDAVA
jgi:hypothetical protein